MQTRDVQLIRVSDNRAVFKRGVREVLFEGPDVAGLAERLLILADRQGNVEQVVEAFPGPARPVVLHMIQELTRRRILGEGGPQSAPAPGEEEQFAYYSNFGPSGSEVPALLAASSVLLVGVNRIGTALAQALHQLGVGRIAVAGHVALDSPHPAAEQRLAEGPAPGALQRLSEVPGDRDLGEFHLLCATSESGEPEALLEINRTALVVGLPYLPAWFSDLLGFVGPLNVPFETPCLRCYRLRRDSNDPRHEVTRAVRRQLAANSRDSAPPGLLPPMADILGQVAALEAIKYLGRFAPPDTIGHLLELNLVSFRSVVRRLLKVPRCPECSDLTVRGPKAITRGSQIPGADRTEEA